MSRNVPGELPAGTVPAAVALRLGVEAGALAQEGEHAFGLKLEEVGGVEVLRFLEWTAGQAHAAQRQRDCFELNFFRISRGMRQGKRLQKRAENKYLNAKLLHATSRGVIGYKIV